MRFHENEILAKISEFTVVKAHSQADTQLQHHGICSKSSNFFLFLFFELKYIPGLEFTKYLTVKQMGDPDQTASTEAV